MPFDLADVEIQVETIVERDSLDKGVYGAKAVYSGKASFSVLYRSQIVLEKDVSVNWRSDFDETEKSVGKLAAKQCTAFAQSLNYADVINVTVSKGHAGNVETVAKISHPQMGSITLLMPPDSPRNLDQVAQDAMVTLRQVLQVASNKFEAWPGISEQELVAFLLDE